MWCIAWLDVLRDDGEHLLLQVLAASYAEDEIQTRYYLTPFAVSAAHEYPRKFHCLPLSALSSVHPDTHPEAEHSDIPLTCLIWVTHARPSKGRPKSCHLACSTPIQLPACNPHIQPHACNRLFTTCTQACLSTTCMQTTCLPQAELHTLLALALVEDFQTHAAHRQLCWQAARPTSACSQQSVHVSLYSSSSMCPRGLHAL